jgi:hypothetical protein
MTLSRRGALVAAVSLWTVFSVGVLLMAPGMSVSLGCMSHVSPPPECEAQQAAVNAVTLVLWTWPTLLIIAAGYVAIALIRVGCRRRSRAAPCRDQSNDQCASGVT